MKTYRVISLPLSKKNRKKGRKQVEERKKERKRQKSRRTLYSVSVVSGGAMLCKHDAMSVRDRLMPDCFLVDLLVVAKEEMWARMLFLVICCDATREVEWVEKVDANFRFKESLDNPRKMLTLAMREILFTRS